MPRGSTIRSNTIKVHGARELHAALKELGDEYKGEMSRVSKSVADFVTADARSAAMSLGGIPAHVAPSLSSRGGVGSAGVAFGGPRFPMAMGAEFGAGQNTVRDRRSGRYVGFRQFEPWRGNGSSAGYFLYPTIRRDAVRILHEYGNGIDDLIRKAKLK